MKRLCGGASLTRFCFAQAQESLHPLADERDTGINDEKSQNVTITAFTQDDRKEFRRHPEQRTLNIVRLLHDVSKQQKQVLEDNTETDIARTRNILDMANVLKQELIASIKKSGGEVPELPSQSKTYVDALGGQWGDAKVKVAGLSKLLQQRHEDIVREKREMAWEDAPQHVRDAVRNGWYPMPSREVDGPHQHIPTALPHKKHGKWAKRQAVKRMQAQQQLPVPLCVFPCVPGEWHRVVCARSVLCGCASGVSAVSFLCSSCHVDGLSPGPARRTAGPVCPRGRARSVCRAAVVGAGGTGGGAGDAAVPVWLPGGSLSLPLQECAVGHQRSHLALGATLAAGQGGGGGGGQAVAGRSRGRGRAGTARGTARRSCAAGTTVAAADKRGNSAAPSARQQRGLQAAAVCHRLASAVIEQLPTRREQTNARFILQPHAHAHTLHTQQHLLLLRLVRLLDGVRQLRLGSVDVLELRLPLLDGVQGLGLCHCGVLRSVHLVQVVPARLDLLLQLGLRERRIVGRVDLLQLLLALNLLLQLGVRHGAVYRRVCLAQLLLTALNLVVQHGLRQSRIGGRGHLLQL